MAEGLSWEHGEGYDIHVLRGGAASKDLRSALKLPPNAALFTLIFVPGFDPAPGAFGVNVDPTSGAVIATPRPTNASRIEINNFLITASIQDSSHKTYSTEIRVYVHDAIDDVWLTPPALTIHKDSDTSRFTVLAAFSDGVIGDITDWALTYKSVDPATSSASTDVLVGSDGTLKAVTAGKTAAVSVTVVLPSATVPTVLTSAPARVDTKPSWLTAAGNATPTFVEAAIRSKDLKDPQRPGTVKPNKAMPFGAARDSVASVLANAANFLFVSEGFSTEQEFNETVTRIVHDLRTLDILQPYKMLQDSINYWSVFVPSRDDGVSLLGDYITSGTVGDLLGEDASPASGATEWTVENMTHEVGLPIFADPMDLTAMAALWSVRYGAKPYATLAANKFAKWRALNTQPGARVAPLNEHDTAFGFRNYERPRAARKFGAVTLGSDPRRTPDADIFFKFIEHLTYGGLNIGLTFRLGGKDEKRICFVCRTQMHAGRNWGGYFVASTGRQSRMYLTPVPTARNAVSIAINTPRTEDWERLQLSTVVAHEMGHSFELGDEYGDGAAKSLDVPHRECNLLPKRDITTTTTIPNAPPRVVYDKTARIKWLWPRVSRAALVSGKPTSTGTRFKVPLKGGHGKPFKFMDIVKFRSNPVRVAPSQDPIFNFAPALALMVTAHSADELELALGPAGGTVVVDLNSPNPPPDTRSWSAVLDALFTTNTTFALVCPLVAPGSGLLVADAILTHIADSNGPLNAEPGNTTGQETQVCAANGGGAMTPKNLPPLSLKPPVTQDIIGIYEGGGGHDCGVFRPAGRCKMRQVSDVTIPLCHVCRYVIVDTLDPTQHGELDKLYPLVSP